MFKNMIFIDGYEHYSMKFLIVNLNSYDCINIKTIMS